MVYSKYAYLSSMNEHIGLGSVRIRQRVLKIYTDTLQSIYWYTMVVVFFFDKYAAERYWAEVGTGLECLMQSNPLSEGLLIQSNP